jgi:hypothetical protein
MEIEFIADNLPVGRHGKLVKLVQRVTRPYGREPIAGETIWVGGSKDGRYYNVKYVEWTLRGARITIDGGDWAPDRLAGRRMDGRHLLAMGFTIWE